MLIVRNDVIEIETGSHEDFIDVYGVHVSSASRDVEVKPFAEKTRTETSSPCSSSPTPCSSHFVSSSREEQDQKKCEEGTSKTLFDVD